jgi:hypothetical protein
MERTVGFIRFMHKERRRNMKKWFAAAMLTLTLGMCLAPTAAMAADPYTTLYQNIVDALGNNNGKFESVDFLLMWLD